MPARRMRAPPTADHPTRDRRTQAHRMADPLMRVGRTGDHPTLDQWTLGTRSPTRARATSMPELRAIPGRDPWTLVEMRREPMPERNRRR